MPYRSLMPTTKPLVESDFQKLSRSLKSIEEVSTISKNKVAGKLFATESLNSEDQQVLTTVANNLQTMIKDAAEEMGIAVEDYQVAAATHGGILATEPSQALAAGLKSIPGVEKSINQNLADASFQIATEAYDERANKSAQVFAVVFNLMASKQDDFGEAFFPTIVINPTEVGALISKDLMYVYRDMKRSVTGSLAEYGRTNVIRAYADHTVLQNEMTKCVPVLRPAGNADSNEDLFHAQGRSTEQLGLGFTVNTGHIKAGTKVDLIGLSQTNELLQSGLMGPSDNLDSAIRLESVILEVGADVFVVNTMNQAGSALHQSYQGNTRRMTLDMDNDNFVLRRGTKQADGSDPTVLTELANSDIRFSITATGSVVLDKGDAVVNAGEAGFVIARDLDGKILPEAELAALRTKFADAKVTAWKLDVYRANSNIRQRGQLVDKQTETVIANVPYRSPISVIAPVINAANPDDSNAMSNLTSLVSLRASNEAVTTLLNTLDDMRAYAPVANAVGEVPSVGAIGFNYVKPVLLEDSMVLPEQVDGLSSAERAKDIRAALVERIRYMVNELYRTSEYMAAARTINGNSAGKPTVTIGTDTTIANYLQTDGELRSLGDNFNCRVVSTLDERVAGKIFFTFTVEDGSVHTTVNPMNFGNMFWAGVIPFSAMVERDGQSSREIQAHPRFAHYVWLPVMGHLEVSGLESAVGKLTAHRKVL